MVKKDLKGYHVLIDGKGYILQDGSYIRRLQEPFSPRFATGDPGKGDLSFWQFLIQTDFSGGEGQEIFSNLTKYRQSVGWDVSNGKPRLSRGEQDAGVSTEAIAAPGSISSHMLIWNKQLNLALDPSSGLADGAINELDSGDGGIREIASRSIALWHRDGQLGSFNMHLAIAQEVSAAADKILVYTPDGTLTVTLTTSMDDIYCVIAIDNLNIMAIGYNSSGEIEVHRFKMNANANTVDATVEVSTDYTGEVINSAALDSDGTLYFATLDGTGDDTNGSVLYRMTATDLASTYMRISDKTQTPWDIHRIESLNGNIFLFGAERLGAGQYRPIVVKYPNTVVYRGTKTETIESNRLNYGIRSAFKTIEGIYFLSRGELGNYDSVYLLDLNDNVREVHAFKATTGETIGNEAVALFYNRLWVYNRDTDTIAKSADTRGGLDATGTEAILELSEFGGDTELINKSLYKLILEISSEIPSGESLEVSVNGVSLGTMTAADGTRKEFLATSEVTAGSFIPQFKMARSSTWTGEIYKVTLQFIPTQNKKLAWGFAIRAGNELKRQNGRRSEIDAEEIAENVEAAAFKNTPIELVDVNGKVYNAILTNFNESAPIIHGDSQPQHVTTEGQEYVISVELLEV